MSETTNSISQELALSVRDVDISYRVVRPVALFDFLKKNKRRKSKYFHAIKGVSFDVYRGEIVGMIGKNGSGKSTLLRAIANIYSPDKGSIDVYGNSVGLMAIGVGFLNDLSGRDNIYLSGMLMGFTRKQISDKIDEIIDFSGISRFIDEPVRSYSSGMHSKLAFSITAIMESDIMLVDETLSVGDRQFKKKSSAKMQELIHHEDKTVLIVSHTTSVLRELCQRVIWLDDGIIRMQGEANAVLDAYEEYADNIGE